MKGRWGFWRKERVEGTEQEGEESDGEEREGERSRKRREERGKKGYELMRR